MLKDKLKGILIGTLIGSLLTGGITAAAASSTTLHNVINQGINIVLDGKQLHPTDVNGNTVEPMIYNGTTYLPVRAVASAMGKAVYWDGPTYTVYLGNMDGKLEYPTVMLTDLTSIAGTPQTTDKLTDNYGNSYSSAIYNRRYYNFGTTYEYLLSMKYSHFKGTLYVPEGTNSDNSVSLSIIADGKKIYTSPNMKKTSSPVEIDVNIKGCNDLVIEFSHDVNFPTGPSFTLCLADAGFYQ